MTYGDPLPEAVVDATQEVLGTLGRLDLTVADAVTIRALAGPGAEEAGMGVGGALRWIDANVDRAMPAGAAGRFDVYVTSGPTTIAPGSPPTDTTDYSWALAIVAQGGAAPATAYAKRVGYLDWNGMAITRLVQTFGRRDDASIMPTAPTGDVSAVDARSPAGAAAPPIRAQVGLAEVFRVNADGSTVQAGAITAPSIGVTGGAGAVGLANAGTITWGADVDLFRQQTDVLRTHDNIWADYNMTSGYGSAGQTTIGGVGAGAAAGILMNDVSWYRGAVGRIDSAAGARLGGNLSFSADGAAVVFGAAGDANLYRGAANVVRTDGSLRAVVDVRARDGAAAQTTLGAVGPGGESGVLLGTAGDTSLYRAAPNVLRTDDALVVEGAATLDGALDHNGATVGFFGVAPVARPAARTLTNWASPGSALRAIDHANWTTAQLFDFVMTMAYDLQQLGLFA